MKNNLTLIHILLFITLIILTGCSTYYGPRSPYSEHYENQFENVKLPEMEDIRNSGTIWTFAKPPDEVWNACLRVVSQYEGILGLNTENTKDPRLLFVHGEEIQLKGKGTMNALVFAKFLDTWIAITIIPENGGRQTSVSAAFISPNTGEIDRSAILLYDQDTKAEESHNLQEQKDVQTFVPKTKVVENFDKIAFNLSQENDKVAARHNLDDPIKRWKFVPQGTINEFFYHLAMQIYGPDRWKAKFAHKSASKVSPMKNLENIGSKKLNKDDAKLEKETGNWVSAKMRRMLQVVYCPEVTDLFQGIVERLKKVANEDDRRVKVYVIASPEVNAFALPNGDVFICSGLLEALDTTDDIAAVLAHELDHIFQHDTIGQLEKISNAKTLAITLSVVASVAGSVAGSAVQIASSGAECAARGATDITTDILSDLAFTSVSTLGGVLSNSLGSAIIAGYSEEAELRADYNGARYVWAAGYEVETELRMLEKLRSLIKHNSEKKELVVSGFINCKPGLDKRIENLEMALEDIKANKPPKQYEVNRNKSSKSKFKSKK